jgi:hypothetical protein
MSNLWNFMVAHQVIATLAIGYVWSAFISALPAPGATSGTGYKFVFSFLNVLAANIARAKGATVESSPNFQAAVNVQTAQAGVAPITVSVPTK